MIDFLLSDAGTTALSLVGGFVMRAYAENEKRKDLALGRWQKVVSTKDISADAAEKRGGSGGTWMRRAIFLVVALSLVSVWVAPYFDQIVTVEVERTKGMFFWKRDVKEFVETIGVLMPIETRKAFMMLCGFYLGQGVK